MEITVIASANATSAVTNYATVEGGGATVAASTAASANTVNSPTPTPFGLNDFSFDVAGEDGSPSVLAGAHPLFCHDEL